MDLNENAKLWVWFGSAGGQGGEGGWKEIGKKKSGLRAALWAALGCSGKALPNPAVCVCGGGDVHSEVGLRQRVVRMHWRALIWPGVCWLESAPSTLHCEDGVLILLSTESLEKGLSSVRKKGVALV